MRIVRSIRELPNPLPYPVMAIGVFDGVHCGHQKILRQIASRAARRGGTALLLSFDPHPQKVISSGDAPSLLQTPKQRYDLLADLGVDILLRLPFTRRLSLMKPDEFAKQVLVRLGVREIHVGSNFRFGHLRSGDFSALRQLGQTLGFDVYRIGRVLFRGERISSTRIRGLIGEGRVALAKRLLGRPYQIRGTVIRGAGRGQQIGFPTANLESENELAPATGVYVTSARVNGQWFVAATNVGYRPTVYGDSETTPTIETHLMGFEGNLYGKLIRLEFCFRLRKEKKFESVDALKQQIQCDIERCKSYRRQVEPFLEKKTCP
ncbi:MAG: bifunctional riboflavin kinase/FAD synthetase [bacterium]